MLVLVLPLWAGSSFVILVIVQQIRMKFFEAFFTKRPRVRKLPKVDITKRFALIGRVGQGSMSKVWRARDLKTGKVVALKVLDKEKTLKLESRFQVRNRPLEGDIAIRLKHQNVVTT